MRARSARKSSRLRRCLAASLPRQARRDRNVVGRFEPIVRPTPRVHGRKIGANAGCPDELPMSDEMRAAGSREAQSRPLVATPGGGAGGGTRGAKSFAVTALAHRCAGNAVWHAADIALCGRCDNPRKFEQAVHAERRMQARWQRAGKLPHSLSQLLTELHRTSLGRRRVAP